MGSVNLVVIVESARTLITHNSSSDTNTFHVPSLIAVGAALGTIDNYEVVAYSHLIENRRQIRAFPLLSHVAQGFESSPYAVGRPPKRFIHQWIWYEAFHRRKMIILNHIVQVYLCLQVVADYDGVRSDFAASSSRHNINISTGLDPMGAIIVRLLLGPIFFILNHIS